MNGSFAGNTLKIEELMCSIRSNSKGHYRCQPLNVQWNECYVVRRTSFNHSHLRVTFKFNKPTGPTSLQRCELVVMFGYIFFFKVVAFRDIYKIIKYPYITLSKVLNLNHTLHVILLRQLIRTSYLVSLHSVEWCWIVRCYYWTLCFAI